MGGYGHLGRYELLGELGRGAMARVWRGWDPDWQREVAIKEPLFDVRLSDTMQSELGRRFASEARVAMQLSHPGIVVVYETGVWDGRPAIVMELVDGETLAQRLSRGRMPAREALGVLAQLLDAVGYAHWCGVIHRDIKPENIFLTRDGTVKLADFGIARVEGSVNTVGTIAGTILGTPGYMSPEQAQGKTVDARSDLFSVGVIAYEMLAGFNPFIREGGVDATTIIYRTVHEPAPDLPEYALGDLPVDLRPAIMRALSKHPAERPQTAEEFKATLHVDQLTLVSSGYAGGTSYRTLDYAGTVPTLDETLARTEVVRTEGPAEGAYRHEGSWHNGSEGGVRHGWLPYALTLGAMALLFALFLLSASDGIGGGSGGATTPPHTGGNGSVTPSQGQISSQVEAQVTQSQGESLAAVDTDEKAPVFTEVDASSTLASDSLGNYGAANAIDGDVSTAWGEGVNGSGTSTTGFDSGESIWMTSETAQEVHGVRIMGGYARDENTYGKYNRCRTVYIALSDGTLFEAELADAYRKYQTIDFNGTYQTTFLYVSLGAMVFEGNEFDSTMISEILVY